MTEQTHTEAPVSFNVRCFSPTGYNVQLTLRSDETTDLMPRMLKALDWLQAQGFTPAVNGAKASTNSAAPTCPTHGSAMKPSKHGSGFYCPVRVADDDGTGKPVYCKQKAQ